MNGIFEALGEPRRRAILELLADGERAAGDIVEALQAQGPASQPTVSQHLKVLREAGLVAVRADGTRRLYAIEPNGVATAQAWLGELGTLGTVGTGADPLQGLTQPLDALATEVARGKRGRPGNSTRQQKVRQKRSA